MKPSIAAALLLCLGPASALASDASSSEPPIPDAPAAVEQPWAPGRWSLGAGVGLGGSFLGYASIGGSVTPPIAPTVRTSVERTLSPGWWLVAGAWGSASRRRGEGAGAVAVTTRDDLVAAALTLGVRRALTADGAPVCVSLDAAAVGGLLTTRVDRSGASADSQRGEAWQAGLSTGLSVERELTSGLSLRIGTPLLGISWSRGTVRSDGSGTVKREGASADLTLAPWLELRQAF